jgi:tungstate transport system substrate-binding protein
MRIPERGKVGRRLLPAVLLAVLALVLLLAATGCGSSTTTAASATTTTAAATTTTAAQASTTAGQSTTTAKATTTTVRETGDLVLASTTSTKDSGLFDVLIPAFEKAYPQYAGKVKVVAVGSGEALKLGQSKDADVLLVHSPAAEVKYMADGYGIERKPVMYNDFIIVGPSTDPAGIKGMKVAKEAFAKIAAAQAPFYTRGDNSGTNAKEITIWKDASVAPTGSWYIKTGQGMGETLTITNQKSGYTLTDRATYLAMKSSLGDLQIMVETDPALYNQYHVITVAGAVNQEGAKLFLDWIISPDVQQNIIGTYGVVKYGQQLFIPNAATYKGK